MFQTMRKLLRKKKKVCLLWCAVQYFEKLAIESGLNDKETQERSEFKDDPNVHFLSRGALAHFEPSMLQKNLIAINESAEQTASSKHIDFSNDQFQWPQNSRAYTNIDLGFEYLKIAEGCNNSCAFCIIPKIRGKQVSLSIEELVKESKNLIAQGVKELILIAQDSTRYGIDRYGKAQLFELLEAIDQIEGDFRYRVLYLYPDILTKKHLERLTKLKKFIPYFDLPLQHASPKILKLMGRFYNHEMTLQLLDFIKSNFKEYYIRTNFIIWFPGETEEDFRLLMDFIEQDWFDNIALFEYHDEPLAPSSHLPDKVDPKIMRERFQQARKLVNELYDAREVAQKGKEKVWTITDIRSTRKGEWAFAVRPLLHCPEIDSEDEIRMEQIIESLDGEDLKVGSEISYVV